MKRRNVDGAASELSKKSRAELPGDELLVADEIPRDTMVALNLMRSQFPKLEQVDLKPFVLKTQLYSSIEDRTAVDRELEAMKQEQLVRIFKLNSGQDDFGIMLLSDFREKVHEAKKRMESKHEAGVTVVFDWFLDHVIPSHKEVSISDALLVNLLSRGGKVADKQITVLINAGLLVRQNADATVYWFSIPSIGSVLKSLTQGRKELLQLLSKRRYNEVLLSQLEKRKLRFSSLDMRFHIRDLLGLGKICQWKSTSGLVIRLTKH